MRRRNYRCSDEQGFSLAALITFLTVLSIFVAAAVPVYTTQAQRELEEELIFRGEEYVRAIQKYQRQFGVYPQELDDLIESNEMRFLRREYLDPLTGEGFRLIKANPDGTLEGSRIYQYEDLPLFSGPLGSGTTVGGAPGGIGSGSGGVGFREVFSPAGGGGAGPAGSDRSQLVQPFGGQTSGGDQSGFGGLSQLNGGGLPGFGQPTGGGRGGPSGGAGSQGLGAFQGGGEAGGDATPVVTRLGRGDGGGSLRQGGGSNRTGGGFGATLAGNLMGGGEQNGEQNAPGSGGAQPTAISGIVGVAPNNEAHSLKVYNERDIYAEWEFIALPTTIAAAGQTPGLMPGDQNNAGQPSSFQSGDGPGTRPASPPFGQ